MKSRNLDFIPQKSLKLYYHFGVYTKSGKYPISTFNEYISTHKLSNMTSINKKITIKNSLCYILSIADSIEPFKCGIALSDIEIIKSRCGFKISLDKILFKKIQRKVEELETWLQVHTNITEKNRKIFIEIQSY